MAKKVEKAEKAKEVVHIAGVKPDDGRTYLTTSIGFKRGVKEKYEIYFPIPKSDEEAKSDYGCPLEKLIEFGVRHISTYPDYKTVGFNEDGTLKEGGHEAMQEIAKNYRVGSRVVGTGVKTKARKLDSMVKEFGGGSQEELEAKLAKLAELEAKGMI
jgi:hypothetical protein